LHLPDVSKVVSAFWAGNFVCGHSAHLMLFSDYCYRFFAGMLSTLSSNSWLMFPLFFVSAFWAYYLDGGFCPDFFVFRNQAGSAVWAKIHNTHRIFCVTSSNPTLKFFFPENHTFGQKQKKVLFCKS
jgi:hypothetical protein